MKTFMCSIVHALATLALIIPTAERRRPFAVFAIVYSGPNGRARFYKMGNRTKPCGTAQRNTSAASAEVPRHPHDRDHNHRKSECPDILTKLLGKKRRRRAV
uniref:Secreted protein n=1 Tax=Rhipicephalus zambeziensis TaxID=60191 RepID=A0A224YG71_9ACAR